MNFRAMIDRLRTFLRTYGEFVIGGTILFGLLIGVGCGPSPEIFLPEATARIRGVVLSPQLGRVGAAKVQLEPVGAAPCKFDTYTKSDGTYLMEGICPGLYDVVATALIGTELLRCRLRYVQLSPGQTAILPDLVLRQASVLTGRALLEGATDHSGILALLVGTNRSSTTDPTGAYTIVNVEEGNYAINFTRTGYVEQTITNLPVTAGTTITVPSPVTLRALNPPSSGAIRGRAWLECRTDHSGITVSVDGTDRSLITTPGGFFAFETLPVSSYSITFRKRYFFDKTVGPYQMIPGQPVLTVANVQQDSHRILNRTVQAFEIDHSPNGSQLGYATSATAAAGEVALTDPTAVIFNQILTSGARMAPFAGLSWSPDGKDLLFVRSVTQPANSSSIGVVKSDGTGLRSLLPPATQYLMPAWSPDGNSFTYFLNPDVRTMRVDRSTGSLVATTSTSAGIDTVNGVVSMSGMEWSPTGRVYYSYDQNTAGGRRSAGIWTIFSTGGGKLQITPRTPANLAISSPDSPTMRPDGAKIGFAWRYPPATNEPPNGIYVMDLDGVNATWITTVPGVDLDWAPDRSRITFTKQPTDPVHPNRICEVLVPSPLN